MAINTLTDGACIAPMLTFAVTTFANDRFIARKWTEHQDMITVYKRFDILNFNRAIWVHVKFTALTTIDSCIRLSPMITYTASHIVWPSFELELMIRVQER